MIGEESFTSSLPLIERLLSSVCRRNAFSVDESEDFASWAKLRLVENDFAVFRKFQGRSSLSTYLTAVIVNLFRDYRIHCWGKWRPSAEAKRLGTVAVQLETLVSRDGRSVAEAIAHLQSNAGVDRPTAELERLFSQLPSRTRRRFEGEEALAALPAAESSDGGVEESERRATERKAESALAQALGSLEPKDRLALKLRFADGLQIVEIASLLGEPARPLYSRIERALVSVRRSLEAHGLEAGQASELVGWSGLDLRVDYGSLPEIPTRGPSNPMERQL
jgi:RNA polymerase sigma factor (sigma-70 family)